MERFNLISNILFLIPPQAVSKVVYFLGSLPRHLCYILGSHVTTVKVNDVLN